MDFQYVRDTFYRNGQKPLDRWMHGTRFEKLHLLDKWLDGTIYEAIGLSFDEEQTDGNYHPMRTRRPATKDHWPAQVAGLTSRKMFGGRHIPRIKHTDEPFRLNVQALAEELKLPVKMLEAAKRGSVGSAAILFKFLTKSERSSDMPEGAESSVSVKGVVEVKQTQYCTPVFNEFEELIGVMEHYLVQGSELLKRGLKFDRDFTAIESGDKYWFIKMLDTVKEEIYYPIRERKWNPVEGSDDYRDALVVYEMKDDDGSVINPFYHNLGFVQGVWIKNLTGGSHPEGLGTWEFALDNWLTLDYQRSQNDRGLKYGSAPQLVIKGDLKDEANGADAHSVVRSPSYEIRLASDEKGMDGQSSNTGHDAFLLETNGAASKASDEFVRNLKHSTFEQINSARKDLESIKGAMSGKAIELIDEDFLDLIQELLLMYCTYGYLPLLKKICKAAMIAKHPLMLGATEKLIDGLALEYPPMYLPSAQEIQFLADAMALLTAPQQSQTKGADGSMTTEILAPAILTPEEAREIIVKQLDVAPISADQPHINETQVDSDKMPDPLPSVTTPTGGDLETGLFDDLNAAEHLLTGRNK